MTTSPARLALATFGLFAAVAVLLGFYYWVHKPFDEVLALRIGGVLLDTVTAVGIIILAGGMGRAVLERIRSRFSLSDDDSGSEGAAATVERLALEAGIGLGVLSIYLLLLAAAGLFNGVWLGIVVNTVLFVRYWFGWLRDLRAALPAIRPRTGWEWLCAGLVIIGLALALPVAFAPAVHWDALTYHLVGIERLLETGRLAAHADNFYLGFPENVEMIFGLAVGLFGRDTAAAPVHFMYGLIGVAAVMGGCGRVLGRTGAWTSAGLLFSAYSFVLLFGWPYVDLGAFMYGALLLLTARRWQQSGAPGWALLMGITVGLACGVKYTAGFIGLSAVTVALLWRPPGSSVRTVLTSVGYIVAGAVIVFAPWALKGLVLYGNPIYPLVFNGLEWDAGRSALFSFNERSLLRDGLAWHLPILPVAATVFGRDLTDGYGFTAGLWLLTTWLALPIVAHRLDARVLGLGRLAVALLVPMILVWGVLSAYSVVGQQTRLMLVALPFFAVAGAVTLHGLAQWPRKPLHIGWMIRVLFGVTAALTVVDLAVNFTRDAAAPYLLGLENAAGYRYANNGAYAPMIDRLAELPPETRIRFLFEPRTYDCPDHIVCVGDLLFDHWSRPQAAGQTVEGLLAAYRATGDQYWLVFDTGYTAYMNVSQRVAIDSTLPAALEAYFVPVWTDGLNYTLYTWR